MPLRKEESVKSGKYSDIIDLEFLPKHFIDRIDDIFDSYYGLGMRPSNTVIASKFSPKFPERVSMLSSPELGDKLSEYTSWYSYGADKYKYVLLACTHIDAEINKIMDRLVGSMVADKGNIEAKKAKARSSQEYIVLITYHQKVDGLRILLDNELKNYDKCIQSLSREVSRREAHGGF